MAEHHKGPIEGIDISETVIKEMTEKHEQLKKEKENTYPAHSKCNAIGLPSSTK